MDCLNLYVGKSYERELDIQSMTGREEEEWQAHVVNVWLCIRVARLRSDSQRESSRGNAQFPFLPWHDTWAAASCMEARKRKLKRRAREDHCNLNVPLARPLFITTSTSTPWLTETLPIKIKSYKNRKLLPSLQDRRIKHSIVPHQESSLASDVVCFC